MTSRLKMLYHKQKMIHYIKLLFLKRFYLSVLARLCQKIGKALSVLVFNLPPRTNGVKDVQQGMYGLLGLRFSHSLASPTLYILNAILAQNRPLYGGLCFLA